MNDVNKNLGHATAYGYAKSKGYTGTEDEFAALMADYAKVGERAGASATAAQAAQTAAEAAQTAAETAQGAAEDAAESVSARAAQIDQNTEDISLVKSQLDEDEVVLGVHRIVLTSTTHVPFSVPKGTTITIRTVDGTNFPSNRLNLYDVTDTSTDYFALGSTYGNSRTVTYTKSNAGYVALNVASNKPIMVIWYDDQNLSKGIKFNALTSQDFTTESGFYKDNGSVDTDPEYDSVHTSRIAVNPGDIISISLSYGSAENMWVAYAKYDKLGNFLSRPVLVSETANMGYYNDQITVPDGCYWISFTYRVFTGTECKIHKVSPVWTELDVLRPIPKTVNDNSSIILDGYYNYSGWANVAWSRISSGNRYPYRSTNANRASFPDLLFVRAGTKVHIEGYAGQKYGYGAWTYDPNTQLYTNTLWTSQWYTDSIDWILNDDSYINISVANSTDTTAIPVNTVGVTVSIYDSTIYDHEKRLDALQEVIPSKFVTEMNTTIASVRDVLTEPCLVIPMVTDIHYAPNTSVFQNFDDTIRLMKHFVKNVACDMTVNLGDNINGNSDQALMLSYAYYMLSEFNNIGIPYLFTIGNHDTNYDPGEKFTLGETFSAFYSATKDVMYNPDTKTDYYKDIDELGIRIVSINTQYLNAYVISADTVTWFENVALDTDKTVILLTHQALIANQAWDNRIPSRSADIVNAVNAFINNGGTLIQFCGHAHSDYTFTTPWLNICMTCGKFESVDTSTSGYQAITGYDGTLSSPSRTVGDATEQAWNVVIVRPQVRKVNVIRFGAGDDREYTF